MRGASADDGSTPRPGPAVVPLYAWIGIAAGACFAMGAVGCRALAGLDGYSGCSDGCVGSLGLEDASSIAPGQSRDATMENAIDAEDNAADDASAVDAPSTEVALDATADGIGDAGSPASADASAGATDGGLDCGPIDTIASCGACGRSCDATHAVDAGCSGGACTYQACAAGWSDCDQSPPNSNGCECQTPSCCSGGTCQTAHSNGVGQTFYDCQPTGTYTESQAKAACLAFTGSSTQCQATPVGVFCSSRGICSNGAATCWCWTYSGTGAGTVEKQTGLCPSACPSASGTMWN
jgi:hypothetical protein